MAIVIKLLSGCLNIAMRLVLNTPESSGELRISYDILGFGLDFDGNLLVENLHLAMI